MATARNFALIMAMAAAMAIPGAAGFSQSRKAVTQTEAPADLSVGDRLRRGEVHIISEPGLYGLGRNVGSSEYAVAKGRLIRIDPKTLKVLSILRAQDQILD